MQQELLSKLNKLERTNENALKNTEKKSTQDLIRIEKKIMLLTDLNLLKLKYGKAIKQMKIKK